jgi:Ca2+:H+ antiporter
MEPEATVTTPRQRFQLPSWLRDRTVVLPLIGAVMVAVAWTLELAPWLAVLLAILLAGSVLAAVHHAEVVAHRVGEPFGSLVLAIAVTVIEVALIVTLMVSSGEKSASLARDTVFAAVMITCNGVLGVSVLIGALRNHTADFNAEGSATALATVATLTTLTLVLPSFTTTEPGPEYAPAQLVFAAVASLALYGVFVFVQTIRHREQFVPPGEENGIEDEHQPSDRATFKSLGVLLIALVAVVGLAKIESPAIEGLVTAIGAPISAVGVMIALLVLLPETLAAVRNARRDRVQASMNLALGSAIASIGLTIPTIAVVSFWLPGPLILGLGPTQLVLFAITMLVGALTVLPGRATVQEGAIHLVLLAAFVFLALVP